MVDFTDEKDVKAADEILNTFYKEADEVFKARSRSEMDQHIAFAHPDPANFPPEFFALFTEHISKSYFGFLFAKKLYYMSF